MTKADATPRPWSNGSLKRFSAAKFEVNTGCARGERVEHHGSPATDVAKFYG